ncbi:MAG: hypothetical protein JST80_12625 [Bdellovibrionales bacterium]|nr:hypothetical protein [Bdellovibrionales bacterium]
MKSILLALLVMFGISSAQAHIAPGLWKGVNDSGAECGFIAGAGYFEPNVSHPLNERIRIQVGQDVYTVQHPPVIVSNPATAFFNHDVFQGVLATSTGARAILISMSHEEGREGPTGFQMIDHAWKTNIRQSVTCKNLKFAGRK